MKKVLAIFLAALMMFATLGMTSFAADVVEDKFTLKDALAIAASYADDDGTAPTVLVFNTGAAKLGTTYQGAVYQITAGANNGCFALISETFFAGNPVQLPNIKDAGDGMAANWTVLTDGIATTGNTYGSGSLYKIPDMSERTADDNYIVFYAQLTPNETTPVIAKIMNIFYKVIKVLFGEQLAAKFEEVMLEFGVVIE